MGIKLIALDLDGTLLAPDHYTVTERNLRALRAAAERGVWIVPTSGRVLDLMRHVIETLGHVRYAISSNGAAVEDLETGERLWDRSITPETTEDIIDIMSPYEIPLEVYHMNQVYVNGRTWTAEAYNQLPPEFSALRYQTNVAVDDLRVALSGKTSEKINVDGIPAELSADLWRRVSGLGGLTTTSSGPGNLEINRADANKGAALEFLSEKLGIAREEVMAFGDGDNDAQMLAWAGCSFAMANGSQKARETARRVAASNRMDGVALAVEEFLLGT